mmetsp:Transcript_28024/g.90345  ORF Transcript_28024/g.90345 Transcript_28024/m.90345 type:complete len:207 (-) Transcript_28024:452-1072(-)
MRVPTTNYLVGMMMMMRWHDPVEEGLHDEVVEHVEGSLARVDREGALPECEQTLFACGVDDAVDHTTTGGGEGGHESGLDDVEGATGEGRGDASDESGGESLQQRKVRRDDGRDEAFRRIVGGHSGAVHDGSPADVRCEAGVEGSETAAFPVDGFDGCEDGRVPRRRLPSFEKGSSAVGLHPDLDDVRRIRQSRRPAPGQRPREDL